MKTANEMKITALAPWYGCKRSMAAKIIVECGSHSAYVEPFCGSMAVLLAKPPASMETVNDLHGELVNLARVIADRKLGAALYRHLRRVPLSEAAFDAAKARLSPGSIDLGGPCLARAGDYFVQCWMGMNGVAGVRSSSLNFARRFTKNGGAPAKRWRGAVETIPAFRRRLRDVCILSMDGIGMVERIEDAEGSVIYADPPYLVKGSTYLHDFAGPDHQRLATALRRFTKTRVVVSYYAHPDLKAMYPGWTVRAVTTTKAMISSGKRDGTHDAKAPEVLLINGASLAKGAA